MANGNGFYDCKRKALPHKRDGLGFLVNSDPVDVFTPVHFGSGWVLGRLGVHPAWIVAIGVAWDWVLERKLKCKHPEWFPNPSQDSELHVFADFAVYGAGAYVGRRGYLKSKLVALDAVQQGKWMDVYQKAREGGMAPFDAEKAANEAVGLAKVVA